MNEGKKRELIEELNNNYATFLSYGKEDFIPAGRFFVKDIELDELDEDFDIFNRKNNARVILAKEDDEKFKLTIPLKIFLNDFIKAAGENAEKFGTGYDLNTNPNKIVNNEETVIKLLGIEGHELLSEPKMLYLEDYEQIEAKDSNGSPLSNYSICPVDLGKWRELIRERYILKEYKYKEEQKCMEEYKKIYSER